MTTDTTARERQSLEDVAREIVRFYGTDRTWSLAFRASLGLRIDELAGILAAEPSPPKVPGHPSWCDLEKPHPGPCESAIPLAATPPGAEAGLDVERLARAMQDRDDVAWPRSWDEADFRWIARQVGASYGPAVESSGLRAALERLDLYCENFVGRDYGLTFDGCSRNGRNRDGDTLSERWCLPCEVRAALAASEGEAGTDG